MYQVRALPLTQDDLWSNGTIQQIYLDRCATATLYCLGVMKKNGWEPLRVQGKIGYAYQSETDAQEICARHARVSFIKNDRPVEEPLLLAHAS